MLSKPEEGDRPKDPNEILKGICATCRTPIEVPRYLTRKPEKRYGDTQPRGWMFYSAPTVECTKCKAMVYLEEKSWL